MRDAKYTIKAKILIDLLEGKTLTATDKYFSNTNQYFGQIKKQGIELIEVKKPNRNNKNKHMERRLNPSIENINRARKLLKKLVSRVA